MEQCASERIQAAQLSPRRKRCNAQNLQVHADAAPATPVGPRTTKKQQPKQQLIHC